MFTDYLGGTPRAKLLDFLGDHPTSDYNVTEIAQKSGITRQTVYGVLDDLEKVGMVRHTRDVGQSRMFAISMDHPIIQSVLQADMLASRDGKKAVLVH
ncbi:MAG: winged helix-turn-helix domain-containing protein [Thermoplasmatota archaeon]